MVRVIDFIANPAFDITLNVVCVCVRTGAFCNQVRNRTVLAAGSFQTRPANRMKPTD